MSSQFLEQKTICISAVPGALGHYLGSMIYHAVNPSAGQPNWAADNTIETWPSQVTWRLFEPSNSEYNIDTLKAGIENQVSSPPIDDGITQVVVSNHLDPAAFAQLFPNSQTIKISAQEQDQSQVGYNALYHECFQRGNFLPISQSVADVMVFLNLPNEWPTLNEILQDSMHRDNLAVKLISLKAGKNSLAQCAQQNNANSYVAEYSTLFPYWKADRPAASDELVNILDYLQINPGHLSPAQCWQSLLPKFNQVSKL
jgi:hypothetical protein